MKYQKLDSSRNFESKSVDKSATKKRWKRFLNGTRRGEEDAIDHLDQLPIIHG